MCGIFGLWHTDAAPVSIDELARVTRTLRHRGPDDEGYFLADTRSGRILSCSGDDTMPEVQAPPLRSVAGEYDFAFGFRRLSILDLSPAGHQPMTSADGRYTLVLNGEIYNYVELREELVRIGRSFRSTSDSEVLLAAYEAWGANALARLVGMFAFAIFDRERSILFLARDFFGIKPLYFARAAGQFAFASEIGALLELPWVRRRANPQGVFNYLRFGLTDDEDTTMLSGVEQIPAGHMMEVTAKTSAAPTRYWQIDPGARTDISFEEAARRLRDLFVDSVGLHLRSDVPVGACLSGGIDSSAILCAIRSIAPRAEVHAVSYCADDPSLAEEQWIDLVAQRAGAIVHKVRLDGANLSDDLDRLITAQQEPFGSTSIYAQHQVFRHARDAGLKVMLDGQGADELLAGYRPFLAARLASLVRQARLGTALQLGRACAGLPGVGARELMMQVAGLLMPAGLQDMARPLLRRDRVPIWLNRDWFADRGVRFDLLWIADSSDVLREKLLETFTRTSLPMLLRFEDRNSMAHSIESRVPFLTPALVEFVFSLPEHYLIDARGVSKSVFRAAMRGLVPDEILDRRDKIGFATPERTWIDRLLPWIDKVFAGDASRRFPMLNFAAMRRDLVATLAGRARFDFRLWRWINFIVWTDRFSVSFEDR